jgi:adenylate cyclase
MAPSGQGVWAPLVARGPSIVRRLRLASGLVMFSYVFLHFLNHSLGNFGYEAMEAGAQYAEMIWRGPIGGPLLYGAFAIHFSLAFWALYIRRHLRMGWLEAVRLLLGFLIPALIVQHAVGQRLSYTLFDIHRVYRNALYNMFVFNPWAGARQILVFIIAWLHGCMGLHLWLRVKPHYHRIKSVLLAIAVFWPTMALLGVMHGAQQVAEKAQLDLGWLAEMQRLGRGADPVVSGSLSTIVYSFWAGFAALVILVFIARGVRALIERRSGNIQVIYPDGRSVRIPKGLSVLDASRRAGIPHASLCGGRARCSTCRVRVLLGVEQLPPMTPVEARVLARLGADRAVRLACQLRPESDVSIWPLLPPQTTMAAAQSAINATEGGVERFVAILFVDIRRSTELVENRLPFDVVFILNRFFEAVGSAITSAGGKPNQFIGDGVMAIFGTQSGATEACAQALEAARLIDWHVGEMNHALANELPQPIEIGIGIHGGEVIIGTLGYREHTTMTAIGEVVHIASRLQDMTKEYHCQLVVSDIVCTTAGISIDVFPQREVQVRGLSKPLAVRVVDNANSLGGDRLRSVPTEPKQGAAQPAPTTAGHSN